MHGGPTHIKPSYGVHNVSERHDLFVSILNGSAFFYVRTDDYRVCCVGGIAGPFSVIMGLMYQREFFFGAALRGSGLQDLPNQFSGIPIPSRKE